MILFYTLTNFMIGTCLASHAGVICDNFTSGTFILRRSQCGICHTELSLLDELPIISYLFLHGKCRYCGSQIPPKLFVIEFIGGFAFANVNFSNQASWLEAILIFSLLLTAIADYDAQEFELALLFPAVYAAILKNLFFPPTLSLLDAIEFVPVILVLFYYVLQQKLGSGDLLIYLVLAIFYQPHLANWLFLIAAVIFILTFVLHDNKKQPVAFVPYLFLALTLQLLCK